MQNTIYGSENARFETQQTITNGGRAKVAGASRLQTRERPVFRRPPRVPRRVSPETPRGPARGDSGKKRRRPSRFHARLPNPNDRSVEAAVPTRRPEPSAFVFPPRVGSLNECFSRNGAKKKPKNRNAGHGDRVALSPFATEEDAPSRPFTNSPRLHKNKNSKFDVGCAKVGAGGFDAQRSRYDYETSQAAAAQMKAKQLGGAGSFLAHDS